MKIPYEKRRLLAGVGFCSPWIIGFLLLFLGPLVQSIYYAFQNLTITPGGFSVSFAGWTHFERALFSDSDFLQAFFATLKDMAAKAPRTRAQMLRVAGVGEGKMQRYGDAFLREIAAYEEDEA